MGCIFIVLLLTAAVIYLAVKLSMIKAQIKSLLEQLEIDSIKMAHIEFADIDLELLTVKINDMIDRFEQTKIENRKKSKALKGSVADISHDMRTPLTSVIGYLQLSLKDCKDEKVQRNIMIALERAKYCSSLINNFFEISVIDAHEIRPVIEKLDINGLICDQILANFQSFEEKGIIPCFADSNIPVWVYADRNMISRIIQNLISNSIKYTDGDVNFEVRTGEKAEVIVSNPIKEMNIDVEHIFDKFYRQDAARSLNGAGLGLYICKTFAEAMNGSIWAKAEEGILYFMMELPIKEQMNEKL